MIQKLFMLAGLDFGKAWEKKLMQWGWLILRVLVALLMLRHGYGKLTNFAQIAPNFPALFFLSSSVGLFLVVMAEFFASITLALGLLTRWSAFLGFFTMMTVVFVVDLKEPFSEKELAILYVACYLFFMFAGAGKYSLDYFINKKIK